MKLEAGTLDRFAGGDENAAKEIVPHLYDDLRRMASGLLQEERRDHTLQATALVNEAYLRLTEFRTLEWRGEARFMALAGTILRRVLVDHARAKRAKKRGAEAQRVTLAEPVAEDGGQRALDLLSLEEALVRLEFERPELARIVELKYFAGLDDRAAARALDTSTDTLCKRWRLARAWLLRELGGAEAGPTA